MASTLEQRTVAINLLKSKANAVDSVKTALAGIAALDPATSTAAEIQAQIDAYNTVRTTRANYGNVSIPSLDSADALSAIATEAAAV